MLPSPVRARLQGEVFRHRLEEVFRHRHQEEV
jgi:hypothetical protein